MSFRTLCAAALMALAAAVTPAQVQDTSLLPKYGSLPKNEAQQAADAKFLSAIDAQHDANRSKASVEIAARGWQLLRQGNFQDAMRRFNQAWSLDNANATALWGMAVVMAEYGQTAESLLLFAEADRTRGSDIDFSVDYAKALGIAGAQAKDEGLLQDAFARFERNQERAPQNIPNLQNWAVTLFYVGRYAEAWQKVKLTEATPRGADLDPRFIAALQAKMPRQ